MKCKSSILKTALVAVIPLIIVLCANPAAAQVCVRPPTNMVSWWPGDGNAADIIGGNNGTLQNGATFGGGTVDQAFLFDGVDDLVVMGNQPAWDFGSSDFSITFWINPDGNSVSLNGHDAVLSLIQPGDNIAIWITYGGVFPFGSGNRLWLSTDYQNPVWMGFNSDSGININDGLWHFVAVTKSGSSWSMYIDNVLRISESYAFDPSAADLRIGGRISLDRHFQGRLDELTIYLRALTPLEISSEFSAASAGKCKGYQVPTINAAGLFALATLLFGISILYLMHKDNASVKNKPHD